MAKAAKTWDPSGKYWENGGGGTVWNSMVYDAQLNPLYLGTGNGAPWARQAAAWPAATTSTSSFDRGPLDPDTGKYVWHYQETPGDNWDYTSAQDLILADIKLKGKTRKVILHAPKNGFFFVIDRTNGKFISADKYVEVNWATGYGKDGRPVEIAEARSADHPFDIVPGPYGGHNWQSMAYSPLTGLAYFPAQERAAGAGRGSAVERPQQQPCRRDPDRHRLEPGLRDQPAPAAEPALRPLRGLGSGGAQAGLGRG